MNKRFALIALLLAALMLLSGCNLIGHDDELDGAQVDRVCELARSRFLQLMAGRR